PIIIALFYFEQKWGAEAIWIAAALFIVVALTDFLDGWVARKRNQISAFGTFLDPVSDKIFVGALLVVLAGFGRLPGLYVIPAVIIMAREFLVSGSREYFAPHGLTMPISPPAKWKTATHMSSPPFLIIGPYLPGAPLFGQFTFSLPAILAVITARDYLKIGLE